MIDQLVQGWISTHLSAHLARITDVLIYIDDAHFPSIILMLSFTILLSSQEGKYNLFGTENIKYKTFSQSTNDKACRPAQCKLIFDLTVNKANREDIKVCSVVLAK